MAEYNEHETSQQITIEEGVIAGSTWSSMKKVVASGINTVGDLARQTPTTLAEQSGVGKDTCEGYISTALKMIDEGYITGDQLWDRLKNRLKLTTGSRAVDMILQGGIEENTTTEVSGENGSGKTQLMHMLAILAQQPISEGGLGGKVVWIDTENTFRPDRINQICMSRGFDTLTMLKGVLYEEAYHSKHQQDIVAKLPRMCHDHDIKLVIVDSMMAHLRSEYIGRANLAARQNILGDILQRLGKVAQNHKLTVVYTNQVMDRPVAYGNPQTAIGGHIMGHASTLRLHIRKGRQGSRVMVLKKSPFLPEAEAVFLITEKGIEDTPANLKLWAKEEETDE
jgi:DNA repair protein RadA